MVTIAAGTSPGFSYSKGFMLGSWFYAVDTRICPVGMPDLGTFYQIILMAGAKTYIRDARIIEYLQWPVCGAWHLIENREKRLAAGIGKPVGAYKSNAPW